MFKNLFFYTFFTLFVFLFSSNLIRTNAFAQTTNNKTKDTLNYLMPSLTVTSDKAEGQNAPIPFSSINSSEISQRYIYQDIAILISELPSLYSYSQNGNGIGYSTLSLRGFDQREISVNVNGIPQNDPEDHNVYWIDFPDLASNLESIEVQRGASLSNFGTSSIGGAINLTTTNFIDKKGVSVYSGMGFQEFGYKNQMLQNVSKFSVEASSGLINSSNDPNNQNKFAFYTRLSRINSFGYRDNSWAYLNSYFLGLAFFNPSFTTQINIFGGPLNDALAYNGIPKQDIYDLTKRIENFNYFSYDSTGKVVNYSQLRRKQEVEEFSQPHFELLNDIKVSDDATIKSSLFYYSGEGYYDYDGTGWTDASSFQLNTENGYPDAKDPQNPIIRAFVNNEQIGWIPRLIINGENSVLNIGLEARFHRSIHWGKIQSAGDLPSNYDPDFKFYQYDGNRNIFSGFVSYNYLINSNIHLFADGQLIYHNYSIDNEKKGNFYTTYLADNGTLIGNGGKLFSINYVFFNPKVGINWTLDEKQDVYSFIGLTSQEPRMENLYNASEAFTGATPNFAQFIDAQNQVRYDFSKPLIKPENLLDVELGYDYKTETMKLNANLYWMLYNNELVKSGQLDIFGDPIDGNAPKTLHIGIELSGSHLLFHNDNNELSLLWNCSYSHNRILDYTFQLGNNQSISLNNNPVAGFPDLLGNARLNYNFKNLFASLQFVYVGESKTDNFGDLLSTDVLKNYLGTEYYSDNTLNPFSIFNFDLSYKFVINSISIKFIELQLQVNNLTNRIYAAGAEGKEFFPGAERNVFLGVKLGLF
jgi:iron complex outermembrane receptor protein